VASLIVTYLTISQYLTIISAPAVIRSRLGTLVPTPAIPGLYLFEEFVPANIHDNFIRGFRKAQLKPVEMPPESGNYRRYNELFDVHRLPQPQK
jgi:hypothetical protein